MARARIEWVIPVHKDFDQQLIQEIVSVVPEFSVGDTATVAGDRPVAPDVRAGSWLYAIVHCLDAPIFVAWGSDPTASASTGIRVKPGTDQTFKVSEGDKLSFITAPAEVNTDTLGAVTVAAIGEAEADPDDNTVLDRLRRIQGASSPLGYRRVTALQTVKGLGSIPAGAVMAIIIPSADVRWMDDGASPSVGPDYGMTLSAGQPLEYDGTLSAIEFILQDPTASGAADEALDVAFYGLP